MAYPELEFLFSAEVFEHSCLNDFSIGLACYEDCILIDHQCSRSSAESAECSVDSTACFLGIVFVILSEDHEIAAVSEEKTDEMHSESS